MLFDFQTLDDLVRTQADPEPFSGAIYMTRGERVIFSQGYGYANRSERLLNRVDTRFQAASGSKIFSAVAVCQLIEAGKLTLESRVVDLLPGVFPNIDPAVNVRHLLTHTSGITSYFEEDVNPDYEALWQSTPVYRMQRNGDFLPLFQNKAMKFAPGTRFEYNDGGFILLGALIEAVSGMAFQDYVQEQVFRRAHMVDAGYFPTDQLPPRTALAYLPAADGSWRSNIFAVPARGVADGGAYTSTLDWYQFWQALRQCRLLGQEMTALLLQPQVPTGEDAPNTHYGLGVWIEMQDERLSSYFVEGYDPGVSMCSFVYPEQDLILTMLANTNKALWPLQQKLHAAILSGTISNHKGDTQ